MKVAMIFLCALALLSLAGNTTANAVGKQATCNYEPGGCSREYDPVCGTDGVSYANECILCTAIKEQRTNIRIKKYGDC